MLEAVFHCALAGRPVHAIGLETNARQEANGEPEHVQLKSPSVPARSV